GLWCAGASTATAAAATGTITPQYAAALGGFAAVAGLAAALSHRNLRLARQEHAAAVHQASHDALTGLPNRLAFMRGLEEMLRQHEETAVIFLDLDGFKSVNDSFGHDVGDQFLKNSVARLIQSAGKERLIARVGGDEFAIALSGSGARHAACKIAGNIIEAMKSPLDCEGRDLFAGASLGIACGSGKDVTAQELLKRADMAMYEAKRNGGSAWEMFDSRLSVARNRCDDLFNAIRQSVDAAKPLPLFYEPVAQSDNNRITAARAVLKWPDAIEDSTGLMGLAAREGFGCELLHQMLERACADARGWPGMRLCVPATAQQLLASDFENRIETVFIRHGADPARIEFQFQASQLSALGKRVCVELMQRLSRRGVQFSLTAFGVGPSDISLLSHSAFSRLVLHENLTSRIAHDITAQQIIQGISAIARAHGIHVGAQGVNSSSDAKLLRLAGVSELSGLHAGAACAPADLARNLARHEPARFALA
ncbi:MAG: diguanylate cyclase, partial [Aestuariivirgaceae bacterium]|nr:diguanylate cyclase [Aestuariivirgaceae bacterium]